MANAPIAPSSNFSPQPLERLNVYDGLIMNAARWDVSQVYMRQRQNLHFQAANQAGIVSGLGVRVIPSPTWSRASVRAQDAQRQEQRWLEIQPGVAIDALGNPIIVGHGSEAHREEQERDRAFRLAITPPTSGSLTVHIVAQYAEPRAMNGGTSEQDTLLERFRFDQKTTLLDPLDVELCRIRLTPGPVKLQHPVDPFNPQPGELDFTHRVPVQARSHDVVRIGVVDSMPQVIRDQFGYLAQAMTMLSPNMTVNFNPAAIQLGQRQNPPNPDDYDLLYIPGQRFHSIVQQQFQWLESFVDSGGTVMVETPSPTPPTFSPQVLRLFPGITTWADSPPSHVSKTQPFLFTQAPDIGNQPINVAIAPGLIWVGGNLSSAWGIQRPLPRPDIRTAHELGINLLYYAWQRRNLKRMTAKV